MNTSIDLIQHNVNLQNHNTLRLSSIAQAYAKIDTFESLSHALQFAAAEKIALLPIGDGSNIILPATVETLVLDVQLRGIQVIKQDQNHIWVEVAAGESWHQWVLHSIQQDWYGLENLALIPGRVGAAPIQNIGAYGCEVKSSIDSVNFIALDKINDLNSLDIKQSIQTLTAADCQFAYRESIFKQALANKTLITSVVFQLNKSFTPMIDYPSLANRLDQTGTESDLSAAEVANAVIAIRSEKLPDPKVLANAGSFFKNIEIDQTQFSEFISQNPDAPYYESLNNLKDTANNKRYKIPSAWLIERCGLKAKRSGDIGIHQHQALVIVNYAEDKTPTTSVELIDFASQIIATVKEQFGFTLQIEPQVIPSQS